MCSDLGFKGGRLDKEKASDFLDMELLNQWVGRQEIIEDTISIAPVKALWATLNSIELEPKIGDSLPVPWHWLYFLPCVRTSELSVDGHPPKGDFLPPVPLPKRMWAGGSIEAFELPKIGENVKRISTIDSVKHKSGASGELVFVSVVHEIFAQGRLAIRERQDLVYREEFKAEAAPAKLIPVKPVLAKPQLAPKNPSWSRELLATTPLLFRYSALTFNSHRIHYDRDYAVNVEGYQDLVVHGPLLATYLLDLLSTEEPNSQLKRFDYRAVKPMLVDRKFRIEAGLVEKLSGGIPTGGSSTKAVSSSDNVDGSDNSEETNKVKLWTRDSEGAITMSADAYFSIR